MAKLYLNLLKFSQNKNKNKVDYLFNSANLVYKKK